MKEIGNKTILLRQVYITWKMKRKMTMAIRKIQIIETQTMDKAMSMTTYLTTMRKLKGKIPMENEMEKGKHQVILNLFVAGISVGDDFLANEHTAPLEVRRRLRAAVGLLLSCRALSGKSRRARLFGQG
ncbi:hypothetical protein ACFXTH_006132 [Malus domestica]